jgi:short-subunit dehydrogenase
MAQSPKLKKIRDQVVVITGASSGIGLATAKLAARKGARLVLSSRNGEDLERICEELRGQGAQVINVVADVSQPDALNHVASAAIREFGQIDTWVNNAGVSSYGKLTKMHLDEKRRIFETNFWGVIHGCRAAVPHLRQNGGAIINIGSVLSNRSIPIQGIYSASKHAVKAYTDALRMELEEEGAPISITLVKPAAINTPYVEHARNHQPGRATHVPPVYAPEVVARAIVYCAEHPKRDIFIGGAGKLFQLMENFMPRFTDKQMELTMINGQYLDQPKVDLDEEGLFKAPAQEGKVHGDYQGKVWQHSWYTYLALRPGVVFAALGVVSGALLAGLFARRTDLPAGISARLPREKLPDAISDLRKSA